MYTEIKSYQYVIALLKKYGIRHCVLSAGSRNVPFVHSVEEDPYFKCYSVVDERSAGYYAIGLAQELNEPVLISCTASTASCNYYPPVAEAYYQGVPIIILTSDRDPHMLGQREDQMIDQVGMFDRHIRKSVNLPIINNKNDEIYCQRLINEALLELNHNGATGPVHINVPTNSYNRTFNVAKLPEVRKIERIAYNKQNEWNDKLNKLKKAKRILVICGQKNYVNDELNAQLKKFFQNYNSTIIVDHMSNTEFENAINSVIGMEADYINYDKMKELMPEIVISFGGQVFSGIKGQLRNNYGKFEHWLIEEEGKVVDLFKNLTTIFEASPEEFFKYMNENATEINNDKEYYNKFKEYTDNIKIPEFKYSNVYAIKNVVENIPENSILHLSINDSIRITNFFKLNKNIQVYANIGTYGIDGCLSSFLGQANASKDKNSYLIIGDLAFFYDMNALRINDIGKNVHILLVNNHGGAEFHYNHTWINDSSDKHTTARHNTTAKGWVEANGFEYLSAYDKKSYEENLKKFLNNNADKPIFFEVFTEMKTDAEEIHSFYNISKPKSLKSTAINAAKEYVKKSFGQERAKKIIDIMKK